ncbi:MAG: hypothetical protein Q4C89_05550 [Deinococcus sp.]|nr:hypothetical protein [Deinococcus sp.]MDO4245466.1 hypothetical protein [Deinococcus sp.]
MRRVALQMADGKWQKAEGQLPPELERLLPSAISSPPFAAGGEK